MESLQPHQYPDCDAPAGMLVIFYKPLQEYLFYIELGDTVIFPLTVPAAQFMTLADHKSDRVHKIQMFVHLLKQHRSYLLLFRNGVNVVWLKEHLTLL